jgi:hypothetical protein
VVVELDDRLNLHIVVWLTAWRSAASLAQDTTEGGVGCNAGFGGPLELSAVWYTPQQDAAARIRGRRTHEHYACAVGERDGVRPVVTSDRRDANNHDQDSPEADADDEQSRRLTFAPCFPPRAAGRQAGLFLSQVPSDQTDAVIRTQRSQCCREDQGQRQPPSLPRSIAMCCEPCQQCSNACNRARFKLSNRTKSGRDLFTERGVLGLQRVSGS